MLRAVVLPVRSIVRRSASFQGVWREIRNDGALHGFVAIYFLSAVLLAAFLDATDRLVPFSYIVNWNQTAIAAAVFIVLAVETTDLIRRGSRQPIRDMTLSLRARSRSRLVASLAMGLSMGVFFGTFTSIKNMLPLMVPFWCDTLLADLGKTLHFGHSPWVLLQGMLGWPPVTRFIEILYAPVWFTMLTGFPVLLSLDPDARDLRRRYLLATVLVFVLLGNVLAAAGMSAGPAFYGDVTGDRQRFAPAAAYLSSGSGLPFSAWDLQRYLWDCMQRGAIEHGTGISAFPSLHVAMATLFALAAWKIDLRLGLVFAAYLAAIFAGSIHLGWHYSLDSYVSLVATIGIWQLSGRLASPMRARRNASRMPPGYGEVQPTW